MNGCKSTSICTSNFDRLIRLDTPADTRTAFGESEFSGDVVLRTVPVWLVGSEGQKMKVNAFLDNGPDSTYVRDDVVTSLGLDANERNLRLSTFTDSCVPL